MPKWMIIIIVVIAANSLQAGSIWAKRDKNMKEPYTDNVAQKIGDTLTIYITEDSKVDNSSERDLEKSVSKSVDFDGKIGNFTDLGEFGVSAGSDNSLSGKAEYQDERSYVDSISVVVVDIMPNGNLVVKGVRKRDIGGDIQIIETSGIVRVCDIAYNNTINSKFVNDFHIIVKNEGNSSGYIKNGWLGSILDFLWPF